MRYILKPGVKLSKYRCDRCGQVELLSAEEKTVCMNCGQELLLIMLEEYVPIVAEDPRPKNQPKAEDKPMLNPEPEKKEEPESKLGMPGWSKELVPKKRIGRPPKAVTMSGSCSSCSKAMRAIGGLTCKETCETVKGTDICSLYKQGVPVGSKYAD